ncbi:MAG: DUF1573 domain-containing protein [Candidatus Nealsonbacteria bacterium]
MGKPLIIFLIVGIIALILLGYGYFKATPGVGEGQSENFPKIEITPKYFDFGQASYGDVLEHVFKLKNLGKEPLEIKRVATSCSCTTAKVVEEIVAPGQETELVVTYDTGAMSGPHGMGDQERIIYVKSSDPLNPQVEITIHARIE